MGANFITKTLPGTKTKAEVEKEFVAAQESDRYENGHSYSGGLGMADGLKFVGLTFEGRANASQYLQDNAQKWEEAVVVRYKQEKIEPPSLWYPNEAGEYWLIGAWCAS